MTKHDMTIWQMDVIEGPAHQTGLSFECVVRQTGVIKYVHVR